MDFNMPKMPSINIQSDCKHLSACQQIDIATEDCFRDVHPTKRCNQGQFAQIILLSRILDRLPALPE